MDYEKKYKEIVGLIKKAYLYAQTDSTKAVLEEIFPELKESEDERIRKALIEMVHDTTGDELWVDYNIHKDESIAWLEKQKATTFNKNIEWVRNAAIRACKYMVDNFENSTKQYEDAIAWLEKQGEQKPAWSEEDNEHAESILERLDGMCKKGATFTTTRFAVNQDIDWLKSIKQRIGG